MNAVQDQGLQAKTLADEMRSSEGDPPHHTPTHGGSRSVKRLLLVSHTSEMGGAEFVLLDIARHFGARCAVLVFAGGPLVERLADLGVSCIVMRAGSGMTGVRREAGRWRMLASIPSVISMVLQVARVARRYDVIYPNTQKAGVVMMLAAVLIRRRLVWHMHDILSFEHFAPMQRWLMVRLANMVAQRVLVVSTAARTAFVSGGGDPARVAVVYNGFDDRKFLADDGIDYTLRRDWGGADAMLVGVFSRLSPWKGQHVLLRALPDLPGVHAVVVGDALFSETTYADQLRALASDLGVADRVHWLGHRDDIPALMRAVDVVLHTSTASEPFGRVIVEGMLAGRPVLASDAGASREVLGDESSGIVLPDNPAALAQALKQLFALSPAERTEIGRRNRARAQSLFSMRAMIAGVERAVELDRAT